MGSTLKLALLRDEHVELDGRTVTQAELESAFAAATGSDVHYYTELPGSPSSMSLMKLVVKHRLPIKFTTKPDFSDVLVPDELAAARGAAKPNQLSIVRPDGKLLILPCQTGGVPPQAIAGIQQMIPPPQRVAVIASTEWAAEANPNIQAANQAIPFFGMLIGASAVGNSVWISDGQKLRPACAGADLLIVDSDRLTALPPDWKDIAAASMRKPLILVHDRATFRLRPP